MKNKNKPHIAFPGMPLAILGAASLLFAGNSAFAAAEADLLVAYDNGYSDGVGGDDNAEVLTANSVAASNEINNRSGTGGRMRICGYFKTWWQAGRSTLGGYVGWLGNYGDGYLDDVTAAGDARGADLVAFICAPTSGETAAAVANQPGRYAAYNPSYFWNNVVAHETGGHNYDCDHRGGRENPKTIMLHNYCGGGSQGYYSNPNTWLNGVNLVGEGSCLGAAVDGGDNSYHISTTAQGVADRNGRVVTAPNLGSVVLRWCFTNTAASAPSGTINSDLVSGAAATVLGTGATYTGKGLRIPGGASGSGAAYLQLPAGIISGLTNVTIEIWATPLSAQNWARIMDFNNGTGNYILLSSSIGTDLNTQRFSAVSSGATVTLDSGLPTAAGVQHHYAITFYDNGDGTGRWSWHRDGSAVAWLATTNTLSALQDVNNWLGRSAYSGDAFGNCEYAEVRISNVAMSRDQILANYSLGPNRVASAVTLSADDPVGSASFAAAGNWSDGLAPGAGKTYESYRFRLRTPADGASRTFAGQALTMDGGSLVWKGTSSSSLTINALTLSGNCEVLQAGSGTWTLAGNAAVKSDEAMVRAANGPINLSANLSGNGNLLLLNNTVTLSGNNSTFNGKITVGDGRSSSVSIDSEARLGANPASFTADQLSFNRGWLYTTATTTIDDSNRGIQIGMNGAAFNVAGGTTLTLSSPLTSPGFGTGVVGGEISKENSGTLVLNSGSSSFIGTLNVGSGSTSANNGVVRIANNTVMASAHSPINIIDNTTGSCTLQLDGTSGNITLSQWIALNGRNVTVPAIQNIAGTNSINGMAIYAGGANYIVQSDAGLLTFYGGVIQSAVSGSRTLTFQGGGESAITSTVQDGSATPLNFVKAGVGKLTMSGAMTYTGTTTVSGGTLLVNNTLGPNSVTVANGGTLGGSGAINGAVTVQSGGKLSPGASGGVLTVNNNVTLNAGSTTLMEISKTPLTNDELRVTGCLTSGGTLAVTNLGGALAPGDSFDLFTAAGIAGSFASSNLPPLAAGYTWSFNPITGVLSVVFDTNTPPAISAVSNQAVNEDVATGALGITVADAETPASALVLSAASSNPALVPAGNIVFGGSGSNRTVMVTPAANQFGTATVTLGVSDGAMITTTSFLLTVISVNDPPTISPIANQIGSKDTPLGPLAFTIGDPDNAADSLILSATSSNPGFVPVDNIVFGGSGGNRNVIITPAANQVGTSTITITVSDGLLTTNSVFTFTVKVIATISKADNTVNLNQTNSWVGGVVPDASSIAVWDSTVTSANAVALGGNLAWSGLVISNPAGPVTITSGNTLTLGASGINMSAASQNLSINSGLTIASGNQAWNVASGRTLTVAGAFTRTAPGATLVAGGDTGIVAFNPTLVNGIVGPWASVSSSGAATNNSANGYTYATTTGGTVAPYTAANGVTAFGWTSSNPNTFNYDVSGVQGNLGVPRTANTVRYTGAAGTQNWGNNNTTAITLNGLMNAGSGALTFSQAGGTSFGQVVVGANNELVLNAASAGITIAIPILDGTASGALTIAGAATNGVTLGAANTYSGNTVVNGTLDLGAANVIPDGSGKGNVTVNGLLDMNGFSETVNGLSGAGTVDNTSASAVTLTAGNNNATSVFNGVIKNSGGALSLVKIGTGALTLAGNNTFSGGVTVQTAAGTLNVNSPAALGAGTLNMNISGATLNNSSGAALTVPNALTVSASFTFAGSSDLAFGGAVNLGALAKTITTTAGRLTLAGSVGGSGAFTKSGAGTLALSGANTFSGTTAVNAGTLLINGTCSTGAVTVASSGTLGGNGVIGGVTTIQSGATLRPGASIGVLTVNNNVTLQPGSATVVEISKTAQTNDQLVVSGTLNCGGTLVVTNLSGTLDVGDTFKLFSAALINGSFSSNSLPSLNAGLTWDTSGLSSGVLSVVSAVATNPTNISFTIGSGSVTLSWPADHTGWRLQVQTNTTAVGIGTNWFEVPGSAATNSLNLPVDVNNGSVFYRLLYP